MRKRVEVFLRTVKPFLSSSKTNTIATNENPLNIPSGVITGQSLTFMFNIQSYRIALPLLGGKRRKDDTKLKK